jgi:hypothetical protein
MARSGTRMGKGQTKNILFLWNQETYGSLGQMPLSLPFKRI